jgi:hypothetical protein
MMYQTLKHQAKAREVLDRQVELLAAVHALQPEHTKLLYPTIAGLGADL